MEPPLLLVTTIGELVPERDISGACEQNAEDSSNVCEASVSGFQSSSTRHGYVVFSAVSDVASCWLKSKRTPTVTDSSWSACTALAAELPFCVPEIDTQLGETQHVVVGLFRVQTNAGASSTWLKLRLLGTPGICLWTTFVVSQ